MKKKGQITLFIVIGVIILFIVLLLYFSLRSEDAEQQIEIPFDRASIGNFIQSCVKDTAEEALVILGKQGGFFNPDSFVSSSNYKIAYLYNKGAISVPGASEAERQLAEYIDENMLSCLDNFASFERQGWIVSYEQPATQVQLNERDITVTQSLKVSVERDSVISFDQFTETVPVRLLYILNIAKEIVEFHQVEPEWTDLTALSRHDVDITIFPYKQKLMYSIRDSRSEIRSRDFMFNFALDFG